MRRVTAQLAGIAVLVAAVGPLGSSSAFAEASRLPDSASLTSPVVLQGRLIDTAGATVSGAEVLLSAWPSNTTVKALPIGGTFRTVPIARTVTDSTGAYTLRTALTPAIARLIDRDGLDLQLDVAQDNGVRTFLTQAVPGGALGWLRPTVDAVPAASLVASLPGNAFDPPVPYNYDGPHRCDGAPGCEEKPRPQMGGSCVHRKIGVKESPAVVATAVAGYGVTAKVTYTRGAESAMSTGISYNGSNVGSFAVNGSRTRKSTFDADFFDVKGTKKRSANAVYRVEVAHAVIARECVGSKMGEYRYNQFVTDPMGTTGGFDKPILLKGPVFQCADVKPVGGLRVGTLSDKAYTYQKGFTFSPFAGASFTGHATSGYSETVKVDYHFADNGKENYWCGDSGYPVSRGQRVKAFQIKPGAAPVG